MLYYKVKYLKKKATLLKLLLFNIVGSTIIIINHIRMQCNKK